MLSHFDPVAGMPLNMMPPANANTNATVTFCPDAGFTDNDATLSSS